MEILAVLVAARLAKMVYSAVVAVVRRAAAVAGSRGLAAATEVVAVIMGTQQGLQQPSLGRMPTRVERTGEAAGRIAARGTRAQEAGSGAVVDVEVKARHGPKATTGDAARLVIQENVARAASTHLTTRRIALLLAAKAAEAAAGKPARRIVRGELSEARLALPLVAVAQLCCHLRQPAAVELAMAAQHGQLVP